MARCYNREELLKLRQSPLVAKPANLPPIEEWMGRLPDADHNQKKPPMRGKPDDLPLHESSTNRRPAFESRLSRNNAPEDIVLGPPKTAFASAAGPRSARTFDSPSRGNFADDDSKPDRSNYKDRFKDIAKSDRDVQKIRDDRPESMRTRDNDRWGGARQSRTPFGENDRDFRKNGDRDQVRDKDNSRDTRVVRGFEGSRRNDRDGNGEERRNNQRGRNEPSWYRDDDRQGDDETKETTRRDWRDKVAGRGHGRDMSMGGSQEKEPEWLDEPDDKKQAHSLSEFQQWKEKMKAKDAPVTQTPTSPEPRPNHERTVSGTAKKVETPLVVDSTFDAFFGMFGDKNDSATPGEETGKKTQGKPSKFTGFFGPKAEPKPQEPPIPSAPLPDPAKDRSSEDKEGFQRILKLLDQQQSSSSRNITPFREQTPRNLPQSPPPQPPIPRDGNPRDVPANLRVPKEGPAFPNRDSEFLLNLMKQPQQQQQTRMPRTQPSQDDYIAQQSSLAAFSNLMISPHDIPQQNSSSGPAPGFFDHQSPVELHQREKPPQQINQRPQAKPPAPPGFYDNVAKFFPDEHNLPPGLQRPPPGLDPQQLAQGFVPQRQQQQRQVQPPPGLQQASFPPGLIPSLTSPHHSQPNNGGDRGRPPPGFLNPQWQGPPPGFVGNSISGGYGGQQDGFPPFGNDFGSGQGGHYGR